MIARLERRLAHWLGWHTPECLLTTDPRVTGLRLASPECQAPGMVAKTWRLLGWHRWVSPADGAPAVVGSRSRVLRGKARVRARRAVR